VGALADAPASRLILGTLERPRCIPTPERGNEEGPVSRIDIANAKHPDLATSLIAMRRSAKSARERAIATNTAIVVVRDGELVRIPAATLREAGDAEANSRGALKQYVAPELINEEQGAWEAAASEKHER
jgi:hypothetical protein